MQDPIVGRSEIIDVDGTSINVRRWGDPSGRPLLFLHSLGPAASGALLGIGVEAIVDAGIAVAAPDLPGFGSSASVPFDQYDAARLASLVLAVADRLGWDRFVVSGHSWGGAIASHVVAAAPERVDALVLVDSGHLDYADVPDVDLSQAYEALVEEAEAGRFRARDRADVAAQLELAAEDSLIDALLEGLVDDGNGGLVSVTTGASRGAALYYLMRARSSATWPVTAAAGIPTLLLLATTPDDLRAMNEGAAARFSAAVPHADVRFIEGASHSLITDMRDRFGAIVADWLTAR